MQRFFIGLIAGTLAGIADIVPMLVARNSRMDILSAFTHWLLLGLVLAHLNTPLPKWAEGSIVALLSALPIVILVAARDRQAIVPMLASSVVLGGLSGLALGAALS